MEAIDRKNKQKAFKKIIVNKTLIDIILNGLQQNYKMVIQGITYMNQPSFEDVMNQFLTKIHQMAIKEEKLGQEEVIAVRLQCTYLERRGKNYFAKRGSQRERSFV